MKTDKFETNKSMFEKFKYSHLEKKPDGKLTKEQQALEILKCKYNILYYLENYAMIPLPGGGYTRLEINDKLRTVALLYQASVIHIFQTARQSSKTTIELCCATWYINFWENVKILFFNMKASDNKKNLLEIKKMIAILPKWMRSYDPKRDPNNVEKFRNGIQSEITLMSIDKQNPDATGRGNTGAIYLDEFGFLHNIHIAYTPLSFIYSNYSRISNNNYVPAPYAITSTPADPMSPEGELFQVLWEKAFEVNYDDIKDMLPHEIKKYIETNSESNIAKVFQFWFEYPDRCEKDLYDQENENNILHLLTDPFVDLSELADYSEKATTYLKAVRILCKTKTQLRREVYCEFLSVSTEGIFDEDFLESIPRKKSEKEFSLPNSRGKLKIFEEYNQALANMNNYAICVDPAYRASKGDFAGIVVYNMETNSVSATAKLQLGKINILTNIVKYVSSLYPKGPIIVEKNNFGQAVIETLLEDHKIRQRLYYSYGNKDPLKMSDTQKIDNRVYGIQTDKSSRPKMVDSLIKYVENNYEKLYSADLINELIYLQEKKNGRIEAASGQHDDLIMALSFILYLLEYKEKELKKFKRLSFKEQNNLNNISILNSGDLEFFETVNKLKKMGYSTGSDPSEYEKYSLDDFKYDPSIKNNMLNLIINLNK